MMLFADYTIIDQMLQSRHKRSRYRRMDTVARSDVLGTKRRSGNLDRVRSQYIRGHQ